GDEVLRKLAKVLLDATRRIDVVCRWGGEEFIVLLPTVDLQNALVIADKLRVKIQESKIKEVGSVTASFGVVQIDKGLTLEEVVDRADRALYLAKESGKNCVKS
ncbi:MAG: GGDEF domain-containing protein, partial [Campylobacterota bacterium]|nr:GGDEF domain-containing protein [Campylobacterota bacterium]